MKVTDVNTKGRRISLEAAIRSRRALREATIRRIRVSNLKNKIAGGTRILKFF